MKLRECMGLLLVSAGTALFHGYAAAQVTLDPRFLEIRTRLREFQPDVKWSGRINAIGVHPGDSVKVLAGSDSGGLFISANGGRNWRHEETLAATEIKDIAYFRSNPDIVIATSIAKAFSGSGGGIWRSVDGGQRDLRVLILSKAATNTSSRVELVGRGSALPFRQTVDGLHLMLPADPTRATHAHPHFKETARYATTMWFSHQSYRPDPLRAPISDTWRERLSIITL